VALVVVVVVLAVGISYPALTHGTAVFQLRAAGRDVLNTFRYAREKAITEQQRLMVVVDRDAQRVVLSDEFGGSERTLGMPHHVRIERIALALIYARGSSINDSGAFSILSSILPSFLFSASQMASDAIASGSPGNNPRKATQEEIVELYHRAF
jgi:hypothetical protein